MPSADLTRSGWNPPHYFCNATHEVGEAPHLVSDRKPTRLGKTRSAPELRLNYLRWMPKNSRKYETLRKLLRRHRRFTATTVLHSGQQCAIAPPNLAPGQKDEPQALELLLETPVLSEKEPAEYDLITGRLNPLKSSPRSRTVFLRKNRSTPFQEDAEGDARVEASLGEFKPCAVCGQTAAFGRSSVQDHQTKGDQPF